MIFSKREPIVYTIKGQPLEPIDISNLKALSTTPQFESLKRKAMNRIEELKEDSFNGGDIEKNKERINELFTFISTIEIYGRKNDSPQANS